MAVQNKSKSVLNINCHDSSKNKVYINPNFNKCQTNNFPNNSVMHVNPKFSHLVSNVQCHTHNKNKIFVNPNFIKSNSFSDNNQPILTPINNIIVDNQSTINTANSVATFQQQSENKIYTIQEPIAKSRYCLVRQNVNKLLKGPDSENAKSTFKINKYKSVPWNDIKRNFDNRHVSNNNTTFPARIETNSNQRIDKKYLCSSCPSASKNELKFTNYNNVSLVKHDKNRIKICIDTRKVYKSQRVNQSRLKKLKGNLKKNNIPCPLFRKFGKCLRKARDRCEFLHDKKHVSICRKFIKGLCHDKDCLLSHDLTTKKMPTCYFYLQGTCTKSDCPYLHVKLNEKAKVCPDFLKGYCDKGSKCLQRHVNVCLENKNKQTNLITKSTFKIRYNELKSSEDIMNKCNRPHEEVFQNIKKKSEHSAKLVLVKDENYSEHRYYQEHRNDGSETCEVIKPMRCKLGTLPSFIQL